VGADASARRLIESPEALAAVERELRGRILDEYLADYERRKGPISKEEQDRARQIFDDLFACYAGDG
jgi:hypothetical protein